jgi:hypothetical protein
MGSTLYYYIINKSLYIFTPLYLHRYIFLNKVRHFIIFNTFFVYIFSNEFFGYENTLNMLNDIKKDITQFEKYLPEKALNVWNLYRKCISDIDNQ